MYHLNNYWCLIALLCGCLGLNLNAQDDLALMAKGETYFYEYHHTEIHKEQVNARSTFPTPESAVRYAVKTDENDALRQLVYNPEIELSFKLKKYFTPKATKSYSEYNDYSVMLINKFVQAIPNGDSLAFIKYNIVLDGAVQKTDVLELIYLTEKRSWYLWNKFNDDKYKSFSVFLRRTQPANVLYLFTGKETGAISKELKRFMDRTRIGGYFDYGKYKGLYFNHNNRDKLKKLLDEPFMYWRS